MALLDRLRKNEPKPNPAAAVAAAKTSKRELPAGREAWYADLKSRVHNALFERLDLSKVGKVTQDQVSEDVVQATRMVLDEEKVLLSLEDRERLIREIQHEVFGLGPLEPLLADPSVHDSLVNGQEDVWVERRGKLEKTVARFKDDGHLMRIIDKIVSAVGRRIDESNPMVDAQIGRAHV